MKKVLYFLAFLIKGWEVSLLLLLPLIQAQGKITVFEIGFLAANFSIFQIISAFFAGHLSAKIGSGKTMSLALGFYTLAWTGMLLPANFYLLIPFFAMGGLGSGFFMPIANSTVARLTDKNRAKEFGDFAAFTDLGRVVLAGVTVFLIGRYSLSPAAFYAVLALFSLIVLSKLKIIDVSFQDDAAKLERVRVMHLLKMKQFVYALVTGVGDVFSSSSLYIFIPLLLIPKGIDVSSIGFLSGLFFVGYLCGRLFLGRLADKFGAAKVLTISEILMAVFIVCLIFISSFILAAIALFILGIFTRGTSPVIRAMIAKSAEDKHKFDKAFSLYSASANMAQVSSRTVFGFVAGIFGINQVFYLAGLVALLTLVPLYFYNKISQKYV